MEETIKQVMENREYHIEKKNSRRTSKRCGRRSPPRYRKDFRTCKRLETYQSRRCGRYH